MVMMVMAALAVTTEYRFGTIRTSFQAVPQRAALLLGKTAVVAFLAGVVGLIASFGAWGIGNLFVSGADLSINTGAEWRLLAGQGIIFALSAVIAVAIGILIRQSAGAIAILILWPLLVENLFNLIPKVGDDMAQWSPFANGSSFLNQGQDFGLAGPRGSTQWAPGWHCCTSPAGRQHCSPSRWSARAGATPDGCTGYEGPAGLRGPGRCGPWSIHQMRHGPFPFWSCDG